uniref:Uncharacterized protein n=1 Tax=Nelumbo nucifera TaxID=4432 RepID=A0A822ZYH9_NELNU|nr:TPA_asm: hypothetical protein HUJ06_018126 [Nelumbo nucifera]
MDGAQNDMDKSYVSIVYCTELLSISTVVFFLDFFVSQRREHYTRLLMLRFNGVN